MPRPPTSQLLTHPAAWTQTFGDACVHLLQINYRLHSSTWAAKCGPTGSSDTPCPDIDNLALPLILIRQVVSPHDQLLCTVKQAYERCLPGSCRMRDVADAYENMLAKLSEDIQIGCPCTRRQLFDAFFYGTCLIHPPGSVTPENRNLIRTLQDTTDRSTLLLALNHSLWSVWHEIDGVATVLYCDISQWMRTGQIPQPTLILFDKVFRVEDVAAQRIRAIL